MIPQFSNEAFNRGLIATNEDVAAWVEQAFAATRNFPVVDDNDPEATQKQSFLSALDEIHANYAGGIPWMLLNRMASTVVSNPIGKPETIVSPTCMTTADGESAFLIDALTHALESTGRLNLDVMRTTSAHAGIVYHHGHDCDDCGIVAKVELADLNPFQRVQLAKDYMAQLFISAFEIKTGRAYATLPLSSTIPAAYIN